MPVMQPVVVDTNVLIRAILKPTSSDGRVYALFLDGHFSLYYSVVLLDELTRVLTYPRIARKYHLHEGNVSTFVKTIVTFGTLLHPTKRIERCRDPKDNELLSVAVSASGIYAKNTHIVTADADLLALKDTLDTVIILTPQEFLREIAHI